MESDTSTERQVRGITWVGPVLFLTALALYLVTLSPCAFPGRSAALIAQYAGWDPFAPLSHPLWALCVKVAAWMPFATLPMKLNFISAFFGACAVWLFYELVSRIQHNRTAEEIGARVSPQVVQTVSGIVAAVYLMICTPFWYASTRAHYFSFDIALLLAALLILLKYKEQSRVWLLYLFSLLYGLGATEFATFILIAPAVGIYLLLLMWRVGHLTTRILSIMVLCTCSGLLLYLLQAWWYYVLPVAEWREFGTFSRVLWFVWLSQYTDIARSIPRVGWLLILLVTIIPWFAVVAFPTRNKLKQDFSGSYFLNALITVIAIAVLFNTYLSPWKLFGGSPLVISPYLLIASCAGYLAGYWFILCFSVSRFERDGMRSFKKAAQAVFYPVIVAMLGLATWLNFGDAHGKRAAFVGWYAERILEDAADHRILLSNGGLDNNILAAAHAQDIDIKLINRQATLKEPYREYMATLFEAPRLQGLARIGLAPLLKEWLLADGRVAEELAVLDDPDMWLFGPYEALPHKLVYLGIQPDAEVDTQEVMKEHEAFWAELLVWKDALSDDDSGFRNLYDWCFRHASKVANNLGVFFEDRGESDKAFTAYVRAMELNELNMSALMNSIIVAKRDARPEEDKLEAKFEKLLEERYPKLDMWALSREHGFVRSPEIFVSRGIAWAISGKAGRALREMEKARRSGAPMQGLQNAVATLYFQQGMDKESADAFDEMLEGNPDSAPAILGKARLAMRRSDFDEARLYLDKLRSLGVSDVFMLFEESVMDMMMGDLETAKERMLDVLKERPENTSAWAALASIAHSLDDEETLEQALEQFNEATVITPQSRYILAQVALERGHVEKARRHLVQLLDEQPNNVQALQLQLIVALRSSRRDEVDQYIGKILEQDPRNSLANLVMGGLQLLREEYMLAEASLLISLEGRRTSDALNELGVVMYKQERYAESLDYAREAVEMNPNHGPAWDTLGMTLFELGRIDAAEKALQKSLELRPNNPTVILHMAQLYEKRGLKKEALDLANSLLKRANELPGSSYEEVRALVSRIKNT